MKMYDLVVIGSGTAAQVASARVRKAGRTVAVVDHRPFGGTCALRGCDPKKMLLSGAEAIDVARRMQGRGVTGELRISWPELIAFKRTFTDPVPQKQEAHYAARGIDVFHGLARFTGSDAVSVAGQELKAGHILIATGARPVPLRLPGAEHIITSDRFLELESLPRRIVLIGGGYIAAEFSHIAARAGAQVTVLQRGDRMLPHFEPDLEELDLATGHVAVGNGRLELNEYLQSVSNPLVYAAGDAASMGPPLTPVRWTARFGVSNFMANIIKSNEILCLKSTPRKGRRFVRQPERQILRYPSCVRLKVSANGMRSIEVTCISHPVVSNPKAVNKSLPGSETTRAAAGFLLDDHIACFDDPSLVVGRDPHCFIPSPNIHGEGRAASGNLRASAFDREIGQLTHVHQHPLSASAPPPPSNRATFIPQLLNRRLARIASEAEIELSQVRTSERQG